MRTNYLKSILVLATFALYLLPVLAQSPEKISYQAVIRNSSDALVVNTQIGMKISILNGSANGSAVYVETQIPVTNANGLVSIEIGAGTVLNGDFSTIDWANGQYFIKTEIDPAGGTSYSITGTSQLLSVPYALHAKTAETITGEFAETDPTVPVGTRVGDMQYWNGTSWEIVVATENEGATLQMVGGIPTWVGGTPSLTPNVTNPSTGKTWMDRNLGASRVAVSSDDADSYGDLYQWGRAADGHQIRTSGTTSTLSETDTPGHGDFIIAPNSPYDWRSPKNDNLWQGINGINNPCPSGYRLPTEAEWEAERASWGNNNAAGAFESPLKIPAAGSRMYNDGSIVHADVNGYYWTSTIDGKYSRSLGFLNNFAIMSTNLRSFGLSVRCIKD